VHFLKDVAATHQLSVNVQLRVSGPTTVHLYFLPNYRAVKDINGFELSQPYFIKELPYFLRSSTTKFEYPHRGAKGVPFMKRTT